MSWLSDLSTVLGIPASAATLAAALYAACSAAEKAASRDALMDIGHALKNTKWRESERSSKVIEQVFKATFADRHFTIKCIKRSVLSTLIFSLISLLFFLSLDWEDMVFDWEAFTGYSPIWKLAPLWITALLVMGVIPDYVALAKTRWLLSKVRGQTGVFRMLILVLGDTLLSIIISSQFFSQSMFLFRDMSVWLGVEDRSGAFSLAMI
jgi:hypothetical protein